MYLRRLPRGKKQLESVGRIGTVPTAIPNSKQVGIHITYYICSNNGGNRVIFTYVCM